MKITQHPDGTVTIDTGGHAAKSVAWDGETVAGRIFKADGAQRKTWHVFYPADKADVAVAMDGHRDFAGKAAVEKAAHDYLLRHRKVGLMHADGTDGSGDLVESAIHHGPDWVMKAADDSEQRVIDGDWVGAIQWDAPTWERWEKGELRGVSPQGGALRAEASQEALAGLRKSEGVPAEKGDPGITELVEFEVTRVDGVVSPANGFPVLMMKGLGDPDGLAKAEDAGDGEPEAVPGKPCPTCGQKVDGSVVRAHVRRKGAAKAGGGDPVKCPTCHGDGKIMGNKRDCPDCDATGKVTPAKAEQLAAKSLVERILKAVVDGKVDEDPDVKGGTAVLEQIADLIISEAQELKAGQAGEIEDIEQLACAAGLIWAWRTGEEAAGSGSVMPATVLMASAAKAKSGPSADERRQAAKDGNALPDGSYPIRNARELQSAAVLARSGHGDVAAAKKLIARRAKELGVPNPLDGASKSKIAKEGASVDTETRNDGQIAKAVEDAVTKAVKPLAKEIADLKSARDRLEADLAKVKATPIPGGPVLSANVQVKQPGGGPVDDTIAAKAALMRQKADEAVSPGDRAGYLAYARELDEQARKAAPSA